jgi:hypothetical protein
LITQKFLCRGGVMGIGRGRAVGEDWGTGRLKRNRFQECGEFGRSGFYDGGMKGRRNWQAPGGDAAPSEIPFRSLDLS